MKKIVSIMMTLVMIFSFAIITVSADENEFDRHNYSEKLKNSDWKLEVYNSAYLASTIESDVFTADFDTIEYLIVKNQSFSKVYIEIINGEKIELEDRVDWVYEDEPFDTHYLQKFKIVGVLKDQVSAGNAGFVGTALANNLKNFYQDSTADTFVVLKKIIDVEDPTQALNSVADLPLTTGNIYNPSGAFGRVSFSLSGNTVDLYVKHASDVYHLNLTLGENTDLMPFRKNNAFYYSINEDKYILLSHDENQSVFFNNKSGEWIGYTVWNLRTNEIVKYDKLSLYAYFTKGGYPTHQIKAYLYTDQVLIENIYEIEVSFEYYKTYIGFIDGKDQVYHEVLSVKNDNNVLNKKWIEDHQNKFTASDIAEIGQNKIIKTDSTVLSDDLVQAINSGYRRANKNFDTIKDELPIYELNFGNFTNLLATDVTVVDGTFNIIQMKYVINGEIQVIYAKDLIVNTDLGNTGVTTAETISTISYILLGVAVFGYFYFGSKNKAFKTMKSALGWTILYGGILFVIYTALNYMKQ